MEIMIMLHLEIGTQKNQKYSHKDIYLQNFNC